MAKPPRRRQIWSVNGSGRLLNKDQPKPLRTGKPAEDFQLPYEDAGEHTVHSHTVNYDLGGDDSEAGHHYGSFHAHPGETVSVAFEVDDNGASVTTITRTPDPEED